MIQLGAKVNLVICQKSKIDDWVQHFKENYCDWHKREVIDCTKLKKDDWFKLQHMRMPPSVPIILIINYDLVFRRKELLNLKNFTLMLDESSLIQNETAKRTKFIMKLNFDNLILLSGTPTSGKYENLISQINLLGWGISKDLFWRQYVDFHYEVNEQGFPNKIVDGYKNVDRLKYKLRQHGCRFLKTEEVFDLPEQVFNDIKVYSSKEYRKFRKSRIVTVDDVELVGDTILTKMLYERQLCGMYSKDKLEALKDLLQSSDDRIIVFYNFTQELYKIEDICYELDRPVSIVNGQEKNLSMYDEYDNSVTAIQYQAGAMGLNLQKANKIVYFTPPLSSELFEQSKKRTHRIGQKSTCFYYQLICKGSVEEKIYRTLAMRKDYTDKLFEEDERGS
ncbi:DEAD/DEAH box helicase [Priestia megaterium]|uniref:DEAD/DEAH box helicase n=1 Tax=Priestia megaterium TaxID=1404 RepID=UPI002E1DF4D0|nr:DEAD/DEAH box helicase [Priestia megaterium]